ncbi:MAG: hypothetical protein BWX86_00542 [Verrucomicrobia bacterium ADurb.Bin122]|nr:MAG: hypothetical protein BWX86_00542 [Verrucomicrobia bacterium ADurb.Bin122]
MAASIGSISVLRMEGRVTPMAENVEVYHRPGVDGVGLWKTGKTAPVSYIITEADVSNVGDHVNAAKALAGTLVTVTHGDGSSASNVAVIAPPEFLSARAITNVMGGLVGGAYLVRLRWSLQATG